MVNRIYFFINNNITKKNDNHIKLEYGAFLSQCHAKWPFAAFVIEKSVIAKEL